jgi:hypothetical protein
LREPEREMERGREKKRRRRRRMGEEGRRTEAIYY